MGGMGGMRGYIYSRHLLLVFAAAGVRCWLLLCVLLLLCCCSWLLVVVVVAAVVVLMTHQNRSHVYNQHLHTQNRSSGSQLYEIGVADL